MPGIAGEKLLHMSAATPAEKVATPFIVLTAMSDPARRAALLEQGASDTISKPFHPAELIARVALHLKLVEAQRELTEKNLALQQLSRTDSLTGLANRRHLDERLAAECRRARRDRTPLSVVLGDIDHFKALNDRHGHLVGDRVLGCVAGRLAAMSRETDCAGRFGGEEFLVVLVNNDLAGARTFAERWRRAIEDSTFELEDGVRVSTSVSVGVASYGPDCDTPDQLVRRADRALYQAKDAGRNRVRVYSDSAPQRASDPDVAPRSFDSSGSVVDADSIRASSSGAPDDDLVESPGD
jgi:diguanylate cyclase (GGDEF)-like protein